MKSILLTLFFCYCSILAIAQNAPPLLTVKGIVTDSVTKQPLGYVTVALQDTKTKSPLKSNLTKDDGTFELKIATGKSLQLVLAFVGYKTRVFPVPAGKLLVNIGKVSMAESNRNLSEVSVTAVKPVIKQEIDRISYDIQADPESKVLSVLDMLRKVPLISLDADDNIKLKGNSNYKILINGKPSSLVANNPSDVFKAMPASSIQRIEVITNPPAKYDAEGLAGIINIITVKKVDNGYNGNLNLSYRTPAGGLRGGGFLTVKQGKFGASAFFGSGGASVPATISTTDRTTTGIDPSDLSETGYTSRKFRYNYLGSELSYEIDSLNLITVNINVNGGHTSSANDQSSISRNLTADTVMQGFDLNNIGKGHNFGGDIGFNYQLGFKKSKEQLLTISYNYTGNSSYQFNNVAITNRVYYPTPLYTQANTSVNKEQTLQIDYVQPVQKITIEGGLKGILRNNNSNFTYDTLNAKTNHYDVSPSLSNNYHNFQYIIGAYNSYTYNMNNWAFKAGARLEETIVNADFISSSSLVDQHYLNLIPSLAINRKFSDMSSLNFGYTQRISRPNIYNLNPFVDRSNPDFQSTGNPNLKPVVSNNLQLNYSFFKKVSLNLGLSYSFDNDNILQISSYNPLTDITSTTYENIGKDKTIGSNFYMNYPITKKLNFSLSGSLNYLMIQGIVDTSLTKNHGIQGYYFSNLGYRFDSGWRISGSYSYNSAYLTLQGKSSSSYYYSVNVNKEIIKNKLTFAFGVNNPFSKFRNYVSETTGDNFTQSSFSQSYYRNFNFSLNYRFGKLTSDIKKNKRSINNDDTSGKSTTGSD